MAENITGDEVILDAPDHDEFEAGDTARNNTSRQETARKSKDDKKSKDGKSKHAKNTSGQSTVTEQGRNANDVTQVLPPPTWNSLQPDEVVELES